MITSTQLEELKTDWFADKRDENFVKVNKSLIIGKTKITKYPFLSTQANDLKYVLGKVYFMGKSMLDAMNFKQKYLLKVSKNFSDSYTDGHKIFVSTDFFESPKLSMVEKLDVFLGVTIHEGLHCKYTDFGVNIPNTYSQTEKSLIHYFRNVYEDERIEWLCGDNMPGYIEYIASLKQYFFNTLLVEKYQADSTSMDLSTENLISIFSLCVLRSVRYPSLLEDSHLEFVGEYLIEVKNLLTNNFPKSTEDSQNLAIKTFELIKQFVTEKQGDGDSTSTSGKSFSEKLDSDEVKKVIDTLKELLSENILNQSETSTTEDDIEKRVNILSSMNIQLQELDGCVELADNNTFFVKAIPDYDKYQEVVSTIKQHVPKVRNILSYRDKHQKLVHKAMFNGKLDTSKLVDSRCGVANIYEKHGLVETEKVAACLLIDLSGSMYGEKIQSAQKTAVLLFEALKHNRSIELYVYGHTADDRDDVNTTHTTIYTFYEPKYKNIASLGSIDSLYCNRDGIAILETAKRVRQQTKRKCLMFVISDGAPNAHQYEGSPAVYDTKEKVLQVERTMNMDVIQIAIQSSHEPASMFRNFIKFDSIETLPTDLNSFIKSTLFKKQAINYS